MFHENWYSDKQCNNLKNLLKKVKGLSGDIIEIGCWEGKSTVQLANVCFPEVLIVNDTFLGNIDESIITGITHPSELILKERDIESIFKSNMKQLTKGNYNLIKKDCFDFLRNYNSKIKFIHIDASHDYESVFAVIQLVLPKLVKGGIICGDDFLTSNITRTDLNGGVERAVRELLPGFKSIDNLWYFIQFKKSVIILTTTVNVQDKCYLHQTDPRERLSNYIKSIKQWKQSLFKIIVVENSGYQFDFQQNDNFEIISFNESELPEASYLRGNNSKGASELFSINYAIKNSKLIKPTDFIIKVTGRYFIPGFEKFDLTNFDAVCQNDRGSCEIIGCKYSEISTMFNTSDILNGKACNHIEFIYKNRFTKMNKILILPKLSISGTQMGGANVIRYSL